MPDMPTNVKTTSLGQTVKPAPAQPTDNVAYLAQIRAANATKNDVGIIKAPTNQPTPFKDPEGKLGAMGKYLGTQHDAYLKTQQAQLGKARDTQVAELQKALEDAVTDGSISVREAEKAFTEQKAEIEKGAYRQAESSQLMMGDLGIQNSQQAVGLMQGDNARSNALINKNVTDRDMKISNIRDRLSAVKNKTSIDISTANANYNYGVAGAQGQADMQYSTQMFDMYNTEYQTNKAQNFQMGMQNDAQAFQQTMQNDAQKFEEAMQNDTQGFQERMANKAQEFTLEQYAVQHGYNLKTMSVQQKYQLEQQYKGWLYNSDLQDDAQNFQGSESAKDRGHQAAMQNDAQYYQGGENAKDRQHQAGMQAGAQTWQSSENDKSRNHDLGMLGEKYSYDMQMLREQHTLSTENVVDEYSVALGREMAKYTPGTPEHDLAGYQKSAAEEAMRKEFQFSAEIEAAAKVLEEGGIPVSPGKKPTPPKKNWYENWRATFARGVSDKSGIGLSSKALEEKRLKAYNDELKAWQQADSAYKQYKKVYPDGK